MHYNIPKNIAIYIYIYIYGKSTAVHMGGVLRYKWEAYRDTNGGSILKVFPFLQSAAVPKALQYKYKVHLAIHIGGVSQYLLEK